MKKISSFWWNRNIYSLLNQNNIAQFSIGKNGKEGGLRRLARLGALRCGLSSLVAWNFKPTQISSDRLDYCVNGSFLSPVFSDQVAITITRIACIGVV